MDPYERSKIGDALKSVTFKKGDYVVREVNNLMDENSLNIINSGRTWR